MLTPKEAEVLEILVCLPQLILEYELRSFCPPAWGCKRRRSAIPPLRRPLSKTPPPPASKDGVAHTSDTDSLPLVKANAPSPATPLSFSPSESDDKPKRHYRKRKRDDFLRTIEELTKSKQLLLGEIENVKRYHDDLKAYNLKLKARQDELSVGRHEENPSVNNMGLQRVDASVDRSSMAESEDPDQRHEQVQRSVCQMGEFCQPTTSLASTSGSGRADMGPLGIPDLNISPDESILADSPPTFDLNMATKHLCKVMAAQARQKRIMIKRVKNSMVSNKPRSAS